MTDVVKKVTRTVPPTSRTQSFTQVDAGTGDVLMIKESLGAPASYVFIDAVSAMAIRLNVYHTVFPNREHQPDFMDVAHLPNTSAGTIYKDSSVADIPIGAGEELTFDGDLPVSDIEIVIASGNFTIIVS